ncbi:MAG: DUF362 domain-containing protein [Planctomycetota bacterium]
MTARVGLARLPEMTETERTLRGALQRALVPLGGLRSYVRPGQRVLIKPNQSGGGSHRTGATTSPRLVRVLIRACRDAGARDIWVAESAGHGLRTRTVMADTGMRRAIKGTPARLAYLDELSVRVFDFGEDAGELRWMPAPELLARVDVLINVPKAKTHFVDPLSGACKNWVGLMPQSFRQSLQREGEPYYRANGLFLRRFRPVLTVLDAAWAGEGQGPAAPEPFWWGWLIVSSDPVALDVTLARLWGFDAGRMRMSNTTAGLGVGTNDPTQIELVGAPFDELRRHVRPADPGFGRYPCRVIIGRGVNLEGTLGHWKRLADQWLQTDTWRVFTLRGTPTFLFGAAEDPEFEHHLREGPYVVLDDAALEPYKTDRRVTFVPGSPVPQSYMEHEMIAGMGFGRIYRPGLSVERMVAAARGTLRLVH